MTDLFKQLQGLKSSVVASPTPVSFLFDAKTASKIDKDIIYTIGLNGLEELSAEEDSFLLFHSELFTESFALTNCHYESRSQSMQDHIASELVRITKQISPYFMRPACHKIIEFLLRFYQYHSTCTSEVLYYFLPFHGTKYFIRLLQILPLNNFWHFLSRHQQTGYILQRVDVVKQAIHEIKLLQGLIETVPVSMVHLKFVVAVLIEMVNMISKLSENFMIHVMGFIDQLIKNRAESRLMGMCLIAHIAKKQVFSPHYLHGIIADLVTSTEENALKEVSLINLLLKLHVTLT